VSHAGEHGPAWEVRHAIEKFGAERIQHGIGAMHDPEVVKMLVDGGIACDVCPGSNVALAAVQSMDEHPLAAMLDAGITVTLGSDDPPLMATNLLAEYEHAWNLASLDEAGLRQLADNSLIESFAPVEKVDEWLAIEK
jgi:adenosine deaminase